MLCCNIIILDSNVIRKIVNPISLNLLLKTNLEKLGLQLNFNAFVQVLLAPKLCQTLISFFLTENMQKFNTFPEFWHG